MIEDEGVVALAGAHEPRLRDGAHEGHVEAEALLALARGLLGAPSRLRPGRLTRRVDGVTEALEHAPRVLDRGALVVEAREPDDVARAARLLHAGLDAAQGPGGLGQGQARLVVDAQRARLDERGGLGALVLERDPQRVAVPRGRLLADESDLDDRAPPVEDEGLGRTDLHRFALRPERRARPRELEQDRERVVAGR